MSKSKVNNLQDLLSKYFGHTINILEQKTSVLTAPGEHYGSVMLALDVKINHSIDGQTEELQLVAKQLPANDMLRVAFDVPVTFKKEVFAYTVTIPSLVEFQKEYNIPKDAHLDKIFPKCYGARITLDVNKNEVDDDAILIFENLKTQGFATEDRLIGFDYKTVKIVLRDLARFHAVPIALKYLKPDEFESKVMPCLQFNKGLEQLPGVVQVFHNSIMEGANELEELAPYRKRLQEISDYALDHPWVQRPPPNEGYGTISHSDFWTSNTMLLRDANNNLPLRNIIIDLQVMCHTSLARDLIFFLFTSVINEVLDKHIDEFIKIYYDNLIETLSYFDIPMERYSWENFKNELDEIAPLEVYHILVMLKPICTEPGKVKNNSENFQESDWSRQDLLGPNHRRKLRDTVLSLDKMKWL